MNDHYLYERQQWIATLFSKNDLRAALISAAVIGKIDLREQLL
jgi:hypothetical protein